MVGNNLKRIREFSEGLSERFDVRMENNVTKFLHFVCEVTDSEVTIHSAPATIHILEQFQIDSCRPASVPLSAGTVLYKTMEPKADVDREEISGVPYCELVGSLLYLSNTIRSDIAYVVGLICRCMEKPGISHWIAARYIFLPLWYCQLRIFFLQ